MPTIEYVGPSQADMDAQAQSLTDFQNTLTTNNQTFQDNITNQITKANESTADLMLKIAAMGSGGGGGGGGGGGTIDSAPYAITSEENVGETELSQTTSAIKKKEKPKGSLKIVQSGIQSTAGTGVNYGV